MAKRKPGNNKRQPRMTGAGLNGKCIRYFADNPNGAEFFTPKPKEKRSQLGKDADGNYIVVVKEKALL